MERWNPWSLYCRDSTDQTEQLNLTDAGRVFDKTRVSTPVAIMKDTHLDLRSTTGVHQSEVREKLSETREDTAPAPSPFRALRAIRMRQRFCRTPTTIGPHTGSSATDTRAAVKLRPLPQPCGRRRPSSVPANASPWFATTGLGLPVRSMSAFGHQQPGELAIDHCEPSGSRSQIPAL